jgi:COP9 signalosome complex subunit 2
MSFVAPLRRRMREQVLLNLIRPYHRIRLPFIAKELKLDMAEVELLLVDMILDKRIFGKIDQINGFLLLGGDVSSVMSKKYDAMNQWTATLQSLSTNLATKAHY